MINLKRVNLSLFIAVILTLQLASAIAMESNAGFGDSVTVTSQHFNNSQNSSHNNTIVNITESILINNSGSLPDLPLIVESDNSTETVNVSTIDSDEAKDQNASDSTSFGSYVIIFFIVIFVLGGVGFAGYAFWRRFRKQDDTMAGTIEVSPETKNKLMEYKPKEWTWDYFMLQTLVLIEKDSNETKN